MCAHFIEKGASERICNYASDAPLYKVPPAGRDRGEHDGRHLARRRCMSLFLDLAVAVHEAIHATGGIDQLALASVERVRGVGDFDFYQWVSLTFKFHCLIRLACGLCKEHIAVGHIFEYDGAIVFWMNTFFHF